MILAVFETKKISQVTINEGGIVKGKWQCAEVSEHELIVLKDNVN